MNRKGNRRRKRSRKKRSWDQSEERKGEQVLLVRCYTVVDGEPALDSFPFMIGGIERRAAKKRAVKTN